MSISSASTASPSLTVKQRRISELKPDPSNARVHKKVQVRQIANSIRAFGFNCPVLVDQNDQIIAGHGRLLAAALLGWTEVPAIRIDHLNPAQAKAYMIADNKLTENSSWDEVLLAEQLKDLSLQELNFEITDIGFEAAEIDLRIQSLEETKSKGDEGDEIPEPGTSAVCKPGDYWLLGRHAVLCGNALHGHAYEHVLHGAKADVVFSDPPYNLAVDGVICGNGEIKHREFPMASGEMTESEFTAFLSQAFKLMALHSADGSIHYACIDWRHIGELLAAGRSAYSELKNLCVWVKDNAGMGSLYRSQHELVAVFKNGTAPHANNVQLGRFGRNRSNVWNYAGVNSFARNGTEGNLLSLHPTVKPVAMVADALMDCSNRNAVVLDPFLGSGTTLIAAEKTGRACRGIELDTLYVDTIIRRWQRFTGDKAKLASSGEAFENIETRAATTGTTAMTNV